MRVRNPEQQLQLLDTRVQLDLSLDDLRMICSSFRAVEYQMKLDDEPYLNVNALSLKGKLEAKYRSILLNLEVVPV